MYLSRFLQDYVSVYLPQDGQWNLMADCIEFDQALLSGRKNKI